MLGSRIDYGEKHVPRMQRLTSGALEQMRTETGAIGGVVRFLGLTKYRHEISIPPTSSEISIFLKPISTNSPLLNEAPQMTSGSETNPGLLIQVSLSTPGRVL